MRRRWIFPWLLPAVHADIVRPQSIDHPHLNSSASGQVALVGAFDSLSTVDYVGESSVLAPVSQNDNLISQVEGSWQYYLGASLADATVSNACLLDNGVAILSGNFTTVRGTAAEGIAKLDLNTGSVSSLGDINLAGAVDALWCNGSIVYVGGSFQLSNSQGVAIWNDTAQSWSLPAFGGFPLGSHVQSITPLTNDTVLFGGSLGAPIVGSSLHSNPSQVVGLAAASVQATNNANDPSNILCTSGSAYEASTGSTDSVVTIDIGHTVYLSEIRVVNPSGSSGTQQFRLVTSPSNSIMNLSYVDTNQQIQFCDAYCPLDQSESRVFSFVNQVGTHNLSMSLLSYYGDHAAIQGIELLTNTTFAYANNVLNNGLGCQGFSASTGTDLGGSGNWELIDDYESLNITTGSGLTDAYARFYPNVTSGNFTLNLYTPGCLQHGSCSQRGEVNVTVYPGADIEPVSVQLFQTNNEIKYDPIYNGTLTASEGYPYVEVKPVAGQQTPIEFVALYLEAAFVAPAAAIEIGNLFEFSQSNYTAYAGNSTFEPIGDTTLNRLGQHLGDVRALITFNDSVYVGGNLSGASLYRVSDGQNTSVSTQGVVEKLYTFDSSLYAVQDYNSVYNVTTSYDQVYSQPVDSLALFNLNGTKMLAFSDAGSDSSLGLFDLSVGDWYNGSSAVSGHLSETLAYNSTNFYFGSLRIEEATASGAASVSSSLELSQLPFSLANSTSSRRKRAAGESGGINCGAFYQSANILGGHFTATTSDGSTATNLMLVNGSSSSPLQGINSDWTINAIAVSGDWAVLAGDVGSALSVYSLTNHTVRDTSSVSGSVKSMHTRGDSVVLFGEFSVDGCSDFCLYNVTSNSFSQLTAVDGGTVRGVQLWSGDEAVVYGEQLRAGSNGNLSLLQYGFRSGSYTPYTNTGIEGNITGVTVGQSDSTKFLAASWQNSSGGHNVQLYDGKSWTQSTSPLSGNVTSLSVLSTTQSNSSSSGSSSTLGNNILLVNGALELPGYGNVSVATFDGQSWLPLFVALQGSGPGTINALYSEKQTVLTDPSTSAGSSTSAATPTASGGRNLHMSKGRIVGISFAIAVGAISLLVIIGLVWGYFTQRRQFYQRTSRRMEDADMAKHAPPQTIMAY